jgi:hypothetical protein
MRSKDLSLNIHSVLAVCLLPGALAQFICADKATPSIHTVWQGDGKIHCPSGHSNEIVRIASEDPCFQTAGFV